MKWTMTGSSWSAAGRHGITATAAAVTTAMLIWIYAGDSAALNADLDHVASAAERIAKAVAAMGSAAVAVLAAWRAARAASPESQQAAVANRRDRVVVAIDPDQPPALVADMLATLPEAKAVITNAGDAATAISDKVVSPEEAPAAASPR